MTVNGNVIKGSPEPTLPRVDSLIYCKRIDGLVFADNNLCGHEYSSSPVMYLNDCKKVNIEGNRFPEANARIIKAESCDNLNIQGNHFNGQSTNAVTVEALTVPKLLLSNNHKPAAHGSAPWDIFLSATGVKRIVSIGNNLEMNATYDFNTVFQITGIDIEAMTNANPIVVTWTAHGFRDGAKVKFKGITQANWTALNGNEYVITRIGANTFTINVNGTGFGAYVPGTDPGTYWFQVVDHNLVFTQ
jgi:hypothetical protein